MTIYGACLRLVGRRSWTVGLVVGFLRERIRQTNAMTEKTVRIIDVRGDYNLATTFSLLSMGSGDPCLRIEPPNRLLLGFMTPVGPSAIDVRHDGSQLQAITSGPGSDWVAPHLSALLGVDYRPPTLTGPNKLRRLAARYSGMRIPRLPAISLRLVQVILQQLISYRDACFGWRTLVRRFGTPAPDFPGLWFPPTPAVLTRLASFQFIECGILPQHGRRIAASMQNTARIESTWSAGIAPDAIDRTCARLAAIRGIGPWTVGFLRGAGLGDADAEVLGDYSHPAHVAYFFTGKEESDDQEMLRLLEPYRPNRFYVLALLVNGAPRRPRRGPKRQRLRERFR